jgi:hypothetical protein
MIELDTAAGPIQLKARDEHAERGVVVSANCGRRRFRGGGAGLLYARAASPLRGSFLMSDMIGASARLC